MKQEEKELLLKDLSARLPYGIKVKNIEEENTVGEVFAINRNKKTNNIVVSYYLSDDCDTLSCTQIEFVRPYLRPVSSMTPSEQKEFRKLNDFYNHPSHELIDFYNSHHLDYRSLISKGLALEAPSDMYKFE